MYICETIYTISKIINDMVKPDINNIYIYQQHDVEHNGKQSQYRYCGENDKE